MRSRLPPETKYAGGLWGIWRLRRTKLYRLERLRYSGRNWIRPYIWPVVWAGVFWSCAAGVVAGSHETLEMAAFIAVTVLVFGSLAGACIAGARAFNTERGQNTRDALAMTTARREDLVGVRFLLGARPYAVFSLLVLMPALAWFLREVILAGRLYDRILVTIRWSPGLTLVSVWLTLALLGIAVGELKSLSSRTRTRAHGMTFLIVLGVGGTELLFFLCLEMLDYMSRPWVPEPDTGYHYHRALWAMGICVALGFMAILNLILAAFCLRRAARRFDEFLLAE